MSDGVIVDASAMVDLLLGTELSNSVAERLRGQQLHAPAHFDAEVLSALGRLHRGDSSKARGDVATTSASWMPSTSS